MPVFSVAVHFVSGGFEGIDGVNRRQLSGWSITLSGWKSGLLCCVPCLCMRAPVCAGRVPQLKSLILLGWFVLP